MVVFGEKYLILDSLCWIEYSVYQLAPYTQVQFGKVLVTYAFDFRSPKNHPVS